MGSGAGTGTGGGGVGEGQVLGEGQAIEGEGEGMGGKKIKKRRKKKRPVGEAAGEAEAVLGPTREIITLSNSPSQPPLNPQSQTRTVAAAGAEEDDIVLSLDPSQHAQTPRRRRRTMRNNTASTGGGLGGGRGLMRGASMRRRNVWDDLPDADPVPSLDPSDPSSNPSNPSDPVSAPIPPPPPPPFPYPNPSTSRLPPSFASILSPTEALGEGRRSPPPSFDVALARPFPGQRSGLGGGGGGRGVRAVGSDGAGEEVDEDAVSVASVSTTASIRQKRLASETPREKQRREERDEWGKMRGEGVGLEELVRRFLGRGVEEKNGGEVEDMKVADAEEKKGAEAEGGTVVPVELPVEEASAPTEVAAVPEIKVDDAPEETREEEEDKTEVPSTSSHEASSSSSISNDGTKQGTQTRYSREEKGKSREVFYDAADEILEGSNYGPGVSRATSLSTRGGSAVRTLDGFDDENGSGDEDAAYVSRPYNGDLEVNGESSKMSGYWAREVAAAGIDLDELDGSEEQVVVMVDVRSGSEVETPTQEVKSNEAAQGTPATETAAVVTPTAEVAAEVPASAAHDGEAEEQEMVTVAGSGSVDEHRLPMSPPTSGSKFVEAITDGPDGEIDVVPGAVHTEPDSITDRLDSPPPVPEKDYATGPKSPQKTKMSLPPLFRKAGNRKISNPWTYLRQASGSSANKSESDGAGKVESPGNREAPTPSPEAAATAKSPFFRAANQLFKTGLSSDNTPTTNAPAASVESPVKVDAVPAKPAPPPVPVHVFNRPNPVTRTSATSQINPTGVYKHPFNRAVKPAWMQQPVPIWQDPKAYVMDDGRDVVHTPPDISPALTERRESSVMSDGDSPFEMISPPLEKAPITSETPLSPVESNATVVRRAPPPVPVKRTDSRPTPAAWPFPPPVLASQTPQSETSGESETETSDLDSDSDSSSDDWSVSDAVPRPPGAYRLLPPKGIPLAVLRASNEPPPLPRRRHEDRQKPLGPRPRGPPPPLPPRNRPSISGPGGDEVAPIRSPAPVPPTDKVVKAVEEEVAPVTKPKVSPALPRVKAAPKRPPPLKKKSITPPLNQVAEPVEIAPTAEQVAEPATPPAVEPTSTPIDPRPSAPPPAVSRARAQSNSKKPSPLSKEVPARPRAATLESTAKTATNTTTTVKTPTRNTPLPTPPAINHSNPAPMQRPVEIMVPEPMLAQNLMRPKITQHRSVQSERRPRQVVQQTKLAIKPRYDDRPEQEMKSQLSSRINKWRLAAIRPDPPDVPGLEGDEEDGEGGEGGPGEGLPRSQSMPEVRRATKEPGGGRRVSAGQKKKVQTQAQAVEVGEQETHPLAQVIQPAAADPEPATEPAPLPPLVKERAKDVVPDSTPTIIIPNGHSHENAVASSSSTPMTAQAPVPEIMVTNEARDNGNAGGSGPAVRSELEYTELDLVAARLQGTDREYEGINEITSFVGSEIPRGATPDTLSNLLIAPVEIESKRVTKEGKTKLKLTALGVRVLKCSICLSQFKNGDMMGMMPECGHVGHQKCLVGWLKEDARCPVCREKL